MKYWFDTEFIEDGVTIDLLSIGVVCEDGREFYAQNADADLDRASERVRAVEIGSHEGTDIPDAPSAQKGSVNHAEP